MFVFSGRNQRKILALMIGIATLAGCSDDPVEQTVAERLAEIEGRELTPAEVAERQEVANLLCGVDDSVLRLLWADMTRSQLEFQDWVFGQVCRDRSEVYAVATGRFSSDSTGSSGSTGSSDAETDPEPSSTTTTAQSSSTITAGEA